jgi:hypothetical protein
MAGTRFGLSSKNTLEQLTSVDNILLESKV